MASWNARRHLEHSGLSWTSWWICCSLLCENALFEPSLMQNRSIYTLWRRLIDLPKHLFTKAGLWTKLRKQAFVPCCRTFSSICERHSGTLTDLGNKRKEKTFFGRPLFRCKNDHFTKTGSGQMHGKHPQTTQQLSSSSSAAAERIAQSRSRCTISDDGLSST